MVMQSTPQSRKEKRIPDWLYCRSVSPKTPVEFNFFGGGTIRQMLESNSADLLVVKKRLGYLVSLSMLVLAMIIVAKLPGLIATVRLSISKEAVGEPITAATVTVTTAPSVAEAVKKNEAESALQQSTILTASPPVLATGKLVPTDTVQPVSEIIPKPLQPTPTAAPNPVSPPTSAKPDFVSNSAIPPAINGDSSTASIVETPANPSPIVEGTPSACNQPPSCPTLSCMGRVRIFFRSRILGIN